MTGSDRIRCSVFKSVAELVAAIQQYREHHNADPRPFVWTASATAILEKVARGRQAFESVHERPQSDVPCNHNEASR
jgi:hypothetical protein